MPDTFTGVGASFYDQTAFDLRAWYSLRQELYFDAVATVRAANQSFPGAAVTFNMNTDLAVATTALSESVDVSAVAMADTQITLTLVEQGNAVITTAKLRGSSFIPFDPIVMNTVGYNAGLSVDTLAANALMGGTNVDYSGDATARNTIDPVDILAGNDCRRATAKLRSGLAKPINGYYMAFIHPDVSYDLRGSNGGANWRDPHTYSDPADIWNGEVGVFEGARFIEAARDPLKLADAGSSTTLTDVYGTLFIGQEALAKGYSSTDGNGPTPQIVAGAVTDKLRRLVPMGWYWYGVFGIFRQAALRRVESASTIGANS
jgi:N4-gp56 family major capsid protein